MHPQSRSTDASGAYESSLSYHLSAGKPLTAAFFNFHLSRSAIEEPPGDGSEDEIRICILKCNLYSKLSVRFSEESDRATDKKHQKISTIPIKCLTPAES